MSTTPRTDAAWSFAFTASEFSAASAARQMRDKCAELETELAAAQQEAAHYMSVAQKATDELARLRDDNLTAHEMACAAGLERDRLRSELAEAELKASRYETVKAAQEGLRECIRAERAEAALAEAKVERETVAEASLRSLKSYIDKLKQFAERAEKAEAECLEQARLLGKSGEREADLLGKLERIHSINENILVFAFRYALGRRSTAPGIVADVLINRWNDLKPHTQIQVQREIGSAMAMGEAGSSCDLDTWQKVLALPVQP